MRRDKRYHSKGVHAISTATGLLVAVFVSWLALSAKAAPASVVISEVMWAGSTLSASDEWIELYNPTASDIDISTWILEKAAGSSSPGLTLPDNARISAGGYYIIGNFAKDHASNVFKVDVDYATSSVSLLNTDNGDLVLKNNEEAIIDQAGGDPWLAGESGAVRKSMERGAELADGLLAASWHSATSTLDQKNYGTPRAVNSMPPVNAAPEAALSGATNGVVGQALSWSAEDSSDADDDTLTYSWSFGDGATATGFSATHSYAAAGSFVLLLTVSDGEAEAEAQRTVIVAAPSYSSAVVINELLPNPVGSDTTSEFIELKNTSATAVDLAGWQLDDADGGSAPYTISAGTTIAANGIKSFSRADTKLALNNTGDSARLLDPAGAVKSSYTYSSSVPEGQSYNRTSAGSYVISTTLTPGAENSITAPVDEEEEAEEEDDGDETAETSVAGQVAGVTAKKVSLADVREEEEGTIVTAEGVVSVPPGILGERELYLAGSGIQVYWHRGTWPSIKLGDKVIVTGMLGSNRGEARLKLAAATQVQRQSGGAPPEAHVLKTGSIDEEQEGWLVTVQGKVTETSGDTFYIDDGTGEVKIYIKESTKIDKPAMKVDTAVTITGVVSETTSGYRLLPRFQEDVRLGMVAGLTTFPATGLSQDFIRSSDVLWLLFHLIRAVADGTIGE